MGLRLSVGKTLITHIDDGLDFLGWRIQRHVKRGTSRSYVYTYPAKKSLRAVMAKVKTLCRQVGVNQSLDELLRRLNPALRGWCAYFRPGSSSATFSYLRHYVWQTVWRWLRRKHRKSTWKQLRRQYCDGGWWPSRPGTGLCSTRQRSHHALPLSRFDHSLALADGPPARRFINHSRGLWRARCIERCTPGSGSGLRKRAGSFDSVPRLRPTFTDPLHR